MKTNAKYFWKLLFLLAFGGCNNTDYAGITPEALSIGTNTTVFVATRRNEDDDGNFGPERSEVLTLLENTISLPPSHIRGSVAKISSTPEPHKDLALAAREKFSSPEAFYSRIRQAMQANLDDVPEVTVFLHGFNTSQSQALFALAQLGHDLEIPGAMVLYSWPSQGKLLGYAYDSDSVLYSRDSLEWLLRGLKSAGAQRIMLIAHSMGGQLAMETIRQIDIREPGWPARNLGAVVLVAPDLDVELFRQQVQGMSRIPDPLVVFASERDSALEVSALLRGSADVARLGNIANVKKISDLPVEVIDVTAFSKKSSSAHFVPGTSTELLEMMVAARTVSGVFGSENKALERLLRGEKIGLVNAEELVLSQPIE
jgi:esterase/lipase superfamily enzyme